jgi:hypothetical protein
MPSGDTFSVAPIGAFVQKYLARSSVSVDPFARNNAWATYTNDINLKTSAQRHMDAEVFLWVHPLDWPAVKRYVDAKRKARIADGSQS